MNTSEFEKKLNKEMEPLVNELSEIGIYIKNPWDFVNSPNYYDKAVPILLEHIEKNYHPRNLQGIARSLIIPSIKGNEQAWDIFIPLYKKTKDSIKIKNPDERGLKEALAFAISNMCKTKKQKEELQQLIKNKENGESRIIFVRYLSKRRMITKEEKKDLREKILNGLI